MWVCQIFGIAESISVKHRASSVWVRHREMKHLLGILSLAAWSLLLATVCAVSCLSSPAGWQATYWDHASSRFL